MSPKESEGVSATGVEAMEEDKKHIPLSNNSQNELKSKKTSIDVTKALMLLGFASWSAFEQDTENGNTSEIEARLQKIINDRREERKEYLALIDAVKDINNDLYQKMVSAEGKRDVAFFENDDKESDVKTDTSHTSPPATQQLKPSNENSLSKTPRPIRSSRVKRNSKKNKRNAAKTKNLLAVDSVVEIEKDEAEAGLYWAAEILLTEYNRRTEYRDKIEGKSKRMNQKLQSFLLFKKMQAEKKKQEEKKKKDEEKIAKSIYDNLIEDNNIKAGVENGQKGSTVKNSDANCMDSVKGNGSKNDREKTEPSKRIVKIVKREDEIKKSRNGKFVDLIQSNNIFESKAEKGKMKEAVQALCELNERAKIKKMQEWLEKESEHSEIKQRHLDKADDAASLRTVSLGPEETKDAENEESFVQDEVFSSSPDTGILEDKKNQTTSEGSDSKFDLMSTVSRMTSKVGRAKRNVRRVRSDSAAIPKRKNATLNITSNVKNQPSSRPRSPIPSNSRSRSKSPMPNRKQEMSPEGAKEVISLSNNVKLEGQVIESCNESDQEETSGHELNAFESFVLENLDKSGVVLTENEDLLVQAAIKTLMKDERTKYASVGDVESCEVSDQEAASEDDIDDFEYFYYDEDEMEDFESFHYEEDEMEDFKSFVHENLDQGGFDLTEDEEKLIQEQINYTLNFSEI